jgi:uncharacterized protein (DUF486 family)
MQIGLKNVVVPLMIFLSGGFMATAWLAHLRIRDHSFLLALAMSWAIVLPEYVLNVVATRMGYGTFTGGQMASMHLASGVVCVMLVSRFVLGEDLGARHAAGFVLLLAGMLLLLQNAPAKAAT